MKGIGTDIIEITRIERALNHHKERFCRKLFTEKERARGKSHSSPATFFAGRFAAKEAISKALGTGIGRALCWLDMEILPDSKGRPLVAFSKRVHIQWPDLSILLSISHCKAYATAVALYVEQVKID